VHSPNSLQRNFIREKIRRPLHEVSRQSLRFNRGNDAHIKLPATETHARSKATQMRLRERILEVFRPPNLHF